MEQKEITSGIDAFVEAYRAEMIEELSLLVAIPSAGGEGCKEMLRRGSTLFEKTGLRIAVREQYVLGEYGEGKKSIGIFAHGDVVPPGEGWIYTEPFSPRIMDGVMIGRGCCDDKAAILEMLYATRCIRALGLPLKSRLVLFLGSAEETGMADVRAFVRRENIPTVSIVPDGNYPYVYGEKGRIVFTIKSRDAFLDILELEGGTAENCMLAACKIKIACPKEAQADFRAICGEHFVRAEGNEVFLQAEGRAAHAAHPEGGKNALFGIAEKLAACEMLADIDRRILKDAARFSGDAYGEGLGIAQTDRTMGRLTCVNSIAKTKEGHLLLAFDIRYGGNPVSEILKALEGLEAWSLETVSVSPGYCHGKNNPVGQAIGKAYAQYTGDEGEGETMGGGTYARHLPNAFPVGVMLGESVKDFPKGHGGIHEPDEAISIDGFIEATKLLVHTILAVDKTL